MAEKNKKKKELSFDTKALITVAGIGAGATGVMGVIYYMYLRGLKKQNGEAIDKVVESVIEDREKNGNVCDVYLLGFINYICGKSEKVKDTLIEEGIIKGDGWGLPLTKDDE